MGRWYEPTLEELFADGAVQQLMASDRVSEATLRALLGKLRQSREGPPCRSVDCSTTAL